MERAHEDKKPEKLGVQVQPYFKPKAIMFELFKEEGYFNGEPNENPLLAIQVFTRVCDMFISPGVSKETVRLTMFPFFLKGKAKDWYNRLDPISISSWHQLHEKFLALYYPPTLASQICVFKQHSGEPIWEAWGRFLEMLRKCPTHSFSQEEQFRMFYFGLSYDSATDLDYMCISQGRKGFLYSTLQERMWLIEQIVSNRQGREILVKGVIKEDEGEIRSLKDKVKSLETTVKSLETTASDLKGFVNHKYGEEFKRFRETRYWPGGIWPGHSYVNSFY